MNRAIMVSFILWITLSALVGCSNPGTVATPDVPQVLNSAIGPGTPTPLGIYGFRFDESAVELTPVDLRQLEGHYNVTAFVAPPGCGGGGCLTYVIKSWNPVTRVLDVDATLKNPTQLTAFDVRLMFLGFAMRDVINADSYSTNYDPANNVNPFIAFGKANPNRQFGPNPTQFTENIKIYWPAGASALITNVVDGNFPGHCPEPYEINNIATSAHMITSGSIDISCDVLDWQSDVDSVKVDTTPLTGGWTSLTNTSGTTWGANVTNSVGAPLGDYVCWIKAHSSTSAAFTEIWHKITIKVRMDKFVSLGIHGLTANTCSVDLGVVGAFGSLLDSNIVMAGDDPLNAGLCDGVDIYGKNYAGVNLYTGLSGLDPANNTYQPWPPERIDITNDGAIGWSNSESSMYNQAGYTPAGGVPNSSIYSNIDRNLNFDSGWPADHRHFQPSMSSQGWVPIDVCDGFDKFQYSLMIDYANDARPMGFEGRPHGNYRNIDIVYYTSFSANGLIGTGPGKIEPGDDIGGIDAYQIGPDTCRMFIVENGSEWVVEAFDIKNDMAGWSYDTINWQWQAVLPDWARPLDVELLPTNPDFIHCPNAPVVCVLVELPSYGGGCVFFYNASNGSYLGFLGMWGYGLTVPPMIGFPIFMDTDDGAWEIHCAIPGPAVQIFKWV